MSTEKEVKQENIQKEEAKVAHEPWNALSGFPHPLGCKPEDEAQDADQVSKVIQKTIEEIIIKDSCDVTVRTTNIQAAVNLQAAIQVAIVAILSITIASHERAEKIAQDLLQRSKIKQVDYQRTFIENSRGVEVHTTDASIAVSIQLLLQILVFLLIRLRIL
ncbi:spore coat protein [Alkalicella caledoniensis]|uniref:spore coat protein n=1 Tax=Alkalicella caledoniensis TaxID=2731377 RepID=UPI001BCD6418|nr:spore coat protein [Alkalicella caledoniensis]